MMKATTLLNSQQGFTHLRFMVRVGLTLLALSYLLLMLRQGQASLWQCSLVTVFALGYLAVQGYWHYGRQARFAPWGTLLLDLAAFAAVLSWDPTTPPPTLALGLALLAHWRPQGTPKGWVVLSLVACIMILALPLHLWHNNAQNALGTLFLLLFLATSALTLSAKIAHHWWLRQRQVKHYWQDPHTGLITEPTLFLTADWLLPLHHRLGAPLTAALFTPVQSEAFHTLNEYLQTRLRRSDILARVGSHPSQVIVLLPDTSVANAEKMIHLLRESAPAFQAVLMAIPEAMSLPLVLERLQQTQGRTPQPPQEETYHAGTVGIS